jgi:hypothetical protein
VSEDENESCSESVGTGEPVGVALPLPVAEALTVEEGERVDEAEREAQPLALGDAVERALALALRKGVPVAELLTEAVDSPLAAAEAVRVGTSEGALVTAAEGL